MLNKKKTPVYKRENKKCAAAFSERQMLSAKPKLSGLVLAGGRSERMGFDKGAIKWHGKEQRYYMADLLKPFCNEVFISCRADQQSELSVEYPTIPDTYTGLGPYGALLSAFREQPDSAWLIIASDLPLINHQTLQHLIDNRNVFSAATAYKNPEIGFPEPLITIWEPKSYPVLLSFLAQGYSSLKKIMINRYYVNRALISPRSDQRKYSR